MQKNNLPVAIIGGGAVGLSAAAHLSERKIPFLLFEQGNSVGHNFLSWQHIKVFSPWKYNIDKAAEKLLLQTNWEAPNKEALPTGGELVEKYFRPLAQHSLVKPYIHLDTKVLSIGRKGLDKMKTDDRENKPFVIKVIENDKVKYYESKAIIDSSGTWNHPNPIGSGGVFAEGEQEFKNNIYYGIPNIKGENLIRYKNRNVLVVGGGHSATNVLLDLADIQKEYPNTQINWVLRKKDISAVYGGKEADALEARGALGIRIEELVNSKKLNVFTPYHILKLSKSEKGIQVEGEWNGKNETIPNIDEIISNTGSRPDLDIFREIRIDLDASLESVFDLAELIDPNVHGCGTVRPHGEQELRHPEKDFYIVGSKSYGRAPTFLMATGYEQVRSIVAYLDGDFESAKRIELDLPETGVCSSSEAGVECCSPNNDVTEKASCC